MVYQNGWLEFSLFSEFIDVVLKEIQLEHVLSLLS